MKICYTINRSKFNQDKNFKPAEKLFEKNALLVINLNNIIIENNHLIKTKIY